MPNRRDHEIDLAGNTLRDSEREQASHTFTPTSARDIIHPRKGSPEGYIEPGNTNGVTSSLSPTAANPMRSNPLPSKHREATHRATSVPLASTASQQRASMPSNKAVTTNLSASDSKRSSVSMPVAKPAKVQPTNELAQKEYTDAPTSDMRPNSHDTSEMPAVSKQQQSTMPLAESDKGAAAAMSPIANTSTAAEPLSAASSRPSVPLRENTQATSITNASANTSTPKQNTQQSGLSSASRDEISISQATQSTPQPVLASKGNESIANALTSTAQLPRTNAGPNSVGNTRAEVDQPNLHTSNTAAQPLSPTNSRNTAPDMSPTNSRNTAPDMSPTNSRNTAPDMSPTNSLRNTPDMSPTNSLRNTPDMSPTVSKHRSDKDLGVASKQKYSEQVNLLPTKRGSVDIEEKGAGTSGSASASQVTPVMFNRTATDDNNIASGGYKSQQLNSRQQKGNGRDNALSEGNAQADTTNKAITLTGKANLMINGVPAGELSMELEGANI